MIVHVIDGRSDFYTRQNWCNAVWFIVFGKRDTQSLEEQMIAKNSIKPSALYFHDVCVL